MLALLDEWTGDAALRSRVLVDNPATLYGFQTPLRDSTS
jgi:predicted TIM-barrel fold metal-dependent hydrolase